MRSVQVEESGVVSCGVYGIEEFRDHGELTFAVVGPGGEHLYVFAQFPDAEADVRALNEFVRCTSDLDATLLHHPAREEGRNGRTRQRGQVHIALHAKSAVALG